MPLKEEPILTAIIQVVMKEYICDHCQQGMMAFIGNQGGAHGVNMHK